MECIMPITEEIRSKIIEHSASKDALIGYLKPIIVNKIVTVHELLECFSKFKLTKKPGQPYVVNTTVLNLLGTFISSLPDQKQSKLSIHFYKLAADRGSHWGCSHYANRLLTQNASEALLYVKKSIGLTQNIPNLMHEHKLTLSNALRANGMKADANAAVLEYWKCKIEVLDKASLDQKKIIAVKIKSANTLIEKIFKEFSSDFSEENIGKLDEALCEEKLAELKPFSRLRELGASARREFILIRERALFFKARYLECLGEYPKAMNFLCLINDNTLEFYGEVIAARIRLLKIQVSTDLSDTTQTNVDAMSQDDPEIDAEKPEVESNQTKFLLPNEVPLPSDYIKFWSFETDYFHTINVNQAEAEYAKRTKQLEELISSRQTEISLIEESDNQTRLEARKSNLEEEINSLTETIDLFSEHYRMHTTSYRRIYRRHVAELRFFNPRRSKKSLVIRNLAHQVIDQRYQLNSAAQTLLPIILSGMSGRQFISAEKAFQSAVVSLSRESNPILGIPTARTQPWSPDYGDGSNEYGHIELYQIEDTNVKAEHRVNPKRQRLGDSFMLQHKSYKADILPFLTKLSNKDKEKEKSLAGLFIRYGKKHQAISLTELKEIYAKATQTDVNKLHRICFLIMEKEQVQWLSASDERYQLGMAVSQARCLLMIQAGFIGFAEAFENDAIFGIYSQTNIVNSPKKVSTACDYIDELYMAYLQSLGNNQSDFVNFFKRNVIEKGTVSMVLTREQAHHDLLNVYGGESDSDGEAYSSDLGM
jgi:hypothetical protein